MEEVCRNLKIISQALNDLSVQLEGFELSQGDKPSLLPRHAFDNKQAQRSSGYVNWNNTHDILKTEHWVLMSQFTKYCGKLERGFYPGVYALPDMHDIHTVDEKTRFPKDELYVNVSNPLVSAEILYIKELRDSAPGLVERFLMQTKSETHTLSSFEKKYGLIWVEPSTEASDAVKIEPIQEAGAEPCNDTIMEPVIANSWCLLEDPEMEEVDLMSKEDLSEEDLLIQKLREDFTNILEELTPQKMNALLEKVKELEINNHKRIDVVAELLFEKALEKPGSSELYATVVCKLAKLKVPSENNPDKHITLISPLSKMCQNYFEQEIMKNEFAETNDAPTKELEIKLDEKNMITRLRAKAFVKLIGELFKVKMSSEKVVVYCLEHLSKDLNEVKLEYLCELLNTAGEQLKEKKELDYIFKKMQEFVDLKSSEISSYLQHIVLDVIDLRNGGWIVNKPVVKALPKTMDEIQEESKKRALLIELMKEFDVGVSGGDGAGDVIPRKGDGRDKRAGKKLYSIDALKLEAASQKTQNYIQLPPDSFMGLSDSVLEKLQADPTSRGVVPNDVAPYLPTYQPNSASVVRPTPNLIEDLAPVVPQAPITDSKIRALVKSSVEQFRINPDEGELVAEVKQYFPPQYHAAIVTEIVEVALNKSIEEIEIIAKLLVHLVATKTIAPENFVAGLGEILFNAPDLLIDLPMMYDYLGKILAPHIEKNHITLAKIFELSELIISQDQGDRLLASIIDCLCDDTDHGFVGNAWRASGLQFSQWMRDELVAEWVYDNDFEYLNFDSRL